MSAALKPANRDRLLSSQRSTTSRADVIPFPTSARTRRERQQLAQQQTSRQRHPKLIGTPQPTVRLPQRGNSFAALPNPQALPAWLRLLTVAQRTSSVVTLGLISGVLTVYGWAVHTQQVYGGEYHRLESLQQQERQLTTASEALKNHLASQAENPATGLVQPTPENAIFLEPAPPRPAPVVAAPIVPDITTTVPLGY